jgi:hypothetical protein
MNSLFSCSWVQKTAVLNESAYTILNENTAPILKNAMSKMKKLNIGTPYRDARLLFYQFLQDKHIEDLPNDYKTERDISPEEALTDVVSMEKPEKRLVRDVDEDGDTVYFVRFGSNRYEFKLKGNDQKNLKIKDLNLDDIESAKLIFTRKMFGTDVNHLFDKMIVSQKDPSKFLEDIHKEFNNYIEEKEEGYDDSRLVVFLNTAAALRELTPAKNKPINPETGKRDLSTREEVIDVATEKEPTKFTPGTDAYDTLKKNLQPDDEIKFLMRGVSGFNIFEAEVGNYQYRINLKGVGSGDITIDQIKPENVGEIFVYDITKEPKKGETPPKVFSTEPDYSKIPEEPGDIEELPPEPETEDLEDSDDFFKDDDNDRRYRVSGGSSDWDSEDEEEIPCVHGCKCSKCMQKVKPQTQNKPVEVVIKLSNEQINKQMVEAFRRKQQNNHRVDRKYGLGY